MCLFSTLIVNPKYKANKKNGGVIPPVLDERVRYVPIGCGNCMECRKQKAKEWQTRLLEDIKEHKNGHFITLTFSDESIAKIVNGYTQKNGHQVKGIPFELEGYNLDNEIATRGVRYFLERYRKKYKKSLRHWLITEIGHNGTENIHLHGIIWTDNELDEIKNTWEYGYVWIGTYVNEKTVNYITKYVTKRDEKHKTYKSKILTSAGIGHNYIQAYDSKLNTYKENGKTNECYRTRTGHKIAMPIYWRNKIYTDNQREQLWLQKLDKEQRWICGIKIDISKNEDHYYKVLKNIRKLNKELGYGDAEKNWNQINYERRQRNIKIITRIKKAQEKEKQKSMT